MTNLDEVKKEREGLENDLKSVNFDMTSKFLTALAQDGVINGTSISRISADSFNLADIGTYQIFFQVSVTEAAQLQLTLNGVALDYTTVGRTTGTDQIVGMYLINTTTENSVLTVQNPTGNTEAITITPSAGGTQAVSAHLVITQL